MSSGQVTWLFAAALAASVGAYLRYGVREEQVPGRLLPAILWAAAVFLILAGMILPPLRTPPKLPAPRVVILDVSASMELPVAPGRGSRLDSAVAFVRGLSPDLLIRFGANTLPGSEPGWLDSVPSGSVRSGTRLTPALRAARAAGADSVVVVTDGELEDREAAREEAERLRLAVREERPVSPITRTTIRGVSHPERVSTADTIPFSVEVWTPTALGPAIRSAGVSGEAGDSVTVSVTGPDGARAAARVPRPAVGRSRLVDLRIPAPAVRGGADWRRFEVAADAGADPLGSDSARIAWIEVAPTRAGPVLISVDADREAGHLLPVLSRTSTGGARAFLRVAPDRWVRAGTTPQPVPLERVRAEALGSDLLVVQGAPDALPGWLSRAASGHDRLLFLVRGTGEVPGTDLSVGGVVEGEWFAELPPPPSPVARGIAGFEPTDLPPAFAMREVSGPAASPVLLFRRDRRGDPRPGVIAVPSAGRRRVVVLAEGTWRWSARTGSSRAVYRALYAGIAGWLLEESRREPVALVQGEASVAAPIGWDVAPGVTDLFLVVRDPAGAEIWRDSVGKPSERIGMPALPPGELSYEARGVLDGSVFLASRPFTVPDAVEELAGRAAGRSLTSSAVPKAGDGGSGPGGERSAPVWPFALAASLLCAEWFLRRRLGLR